MRRAFGILGFGLALAVGAAMAPAAAEAHGWRHHHRHHHHHHGYWGPRFVFGVAPPYWGWAPPPVVVYPPRVVVEEPPVYIERPDPPAAGYWYFCEPAGAYYPDVPSCDEPWVKVPPRPE